MEKSAFERRRLRRRDPPRVTAHARVINALGKKALKTNKFQFTVEATRDDAVETYLP
jgi:hypothetical protein